MEKKIKNLRGAYLDNLDLCTQIDCFVVSLFLLTTGPFVISRREGEELEKDGR